MIALSFGRMSKFEQCASLYRAQYLDKVPEMPSAPLESGKRIHAFLDRYLGHLEQIEAADDPGVVDDMVRATFTDDSETPNTDVFKDAAIVARVFAKHYRHDWAATLGREEWLERYLSPDDLCSENTRVTGRYDRLFVEGELGSGSETIVVRDYKTSWSAELSTDNVFQGQVYVWMLTEKYPALAGRLAHEVYFVRHNRTVRSKVLSPFDLADIEKRIRIIRGRIIRAHEQRDFPPTPGWHCGFCPVAVRCAKRNALVRADVMVDNEEAAHVALSDSILLEAALESRRKQLREYAKRAAPVTLPDGTTAGYDTKSSIVIRDAEALIETLGIDAAIKFLTVNNRRTKPLQNDPATAHLFVEERKSRFEIANRAALMLPAGTGGEGDEEGGEDA